MAILEEKIKRFLTIDYGCGCGYGYGCGYDYGCGCGSGYGSGCGSGDGYGYGCGCDYGSGCGSGYGSGCGSGDGDGCSGDGDGCGIEFFNRQKVYMIDDIPTLIYSVRGFIARGAILCDDLTLKDCYIAKVGNSFAHGDTAHNAVRDATVKDVETRPLVERIAEFKKQYPELTTKATGKELYDWHHALTGSCTMGRDEFCRANDVKMEQLYTIKYFLDLTANSYGSDTIRHIQEKYICE